ncbi:hypothetical protein DP114_15300 [Brasilonema sennae CENA114]|jgi:hypothetical protein|uniref:Uncharacterized protein n=2 Tax=Brasilonema TaxID=383614 RepID=A0A856MCR9_9CYAN|nr:hypothetical protein DP114_15300 [Brasilonema sennae CENA114]
MLEKRTPVKGCGKPRYITGFTDRLGVANAPTQHWIHFFGERPSLIGETTPHASADARGMCCLRYLTKNGLPHLGTVLDNVMTYVLFCTLFIFYQEIAWYPSPK